MGRVLDAFPTAVQTYKLTSDDRGFPPIGLSREPWRSQHRSIWPISSSRGWSEANHEWPRNLLIPCAKLLFRDALKPAAGQRCSLAGPFRRAQFAGADEGWREQFERSARFDRETENLTPLG